MNILTALHAHLFERDAVRIEADAHVISGCLTRSGRTTNHYSILLYMRNPAETWYPTT
jgi:hypothetical protein